MEWKSTSEKIKSTSLAKGKRTIASLSAQLGPVPSHFIQACPLLSTVIMLPIFYSFFLRSPPNRAPVVIFFC